MKNINCEQLTRDLEDIRSKREQLGMTLRGLRDLTGKREVNDARDLLLRQKRLRQDVELLRERYLLLIIEESRDGRIVTIDLKKERKKAIDFFMANGLELIARALPEKITLTAAAEEKLRESMRDGWDRVMLLPSIHISFHEMKSKMADTVLSGLPQEEQYKESQVLSFSGSGFSTNQPAKALRDRPYLVCYSAEALQREFFGMKPENLEKVLAENGWDSLTVIEYYILQRQRCAESGNHDFDRASTDATESQMTWLLGSGNHVGQVPYAGWWPEDQQIVVNGEFPTNSVDNVGLRPIRVVPIGK